VLLNQTHIKMSTEQESKQSMMDPIQYERMMNQMRIDMRKMKEDLEKEQQAKAELERVKAERDAQYQEMQSKWETAKEEKKKGLSEIVESKVRPFLEGLKKDQNPNLVNNVNAFEQNFNQGLDNAFMAPEEMALFQTVEAAASQMAHTNAQLAAKSSELEKMFQNDKEWGAKFEALQNEKAELQKKTEADLKAVQEEKALKEKMLEDFKKEIEQLKSIKAKNMMDTNNLLDGTGDGGAPTETSTPVENTTTPTVEATTTVEATASANTNTSGYNSLLNFDGYKPREDWRDIRRHGW
jgi:hypothetical protein